MIFESLSKSAESGELILVENGYCRYHLRRDGQLTVYEILVLPRARRQGIGAQMLDALKYTGATSILAKCPAELEANSWYNVMGFECEGTGITSTGKELNLWRLSL